jgi:hypothetical protein
LVKNIRRKTRQTYSAEKKIRIVLAGLRGEESISVLCRREGIGESLYYSWSKELLGAGKRRLSGDTARLVRLWRALIMAKAIPVIWDMSFKPSGKIPARHWLAVTWAATSWAGPAT